MVSRHWTHRAVYRFRDVAVLASAAWRWRVSHLSYVFPDTGPLSARGETRLREWSGVRGDALRGSRGDLWRGIADGKVRMASGVSRRRRPEPAVASRVAAMETA